MKLKIKILYLRFKQSKFLLGITCLVIGATSTFNFIEGKELYDYIQGGLPHAKSIIINAEASDSDRTQGGVVSTATHQVIETPTDNISVDSLIEKTFGSQSVVALAVAKAESNLKHDAIGVNTNGTKDVGIFQINDIHGYSVEDRLDPVKNIEMAKKIYDKAGWSAWSAFKNDSFKKHL